MIRDIDRVIQQIKTIYPAVTVEQLKVSHLGSDDDGLWVFDQPGSEFEVQIESSTGMCPFLIETGENTSRLMTNTISETLETLSRLLHL